MTGLHESEEVLKVVRKHWFVLVVDTLWPIAIFLFFVAAAETFVVGVSIFSVSAIGGSVTALGFFVFGFAFAGLWLTLFITWTNYYLDYWVVTNERVIDVEQVGLFSRETSSFRLDRIQDISTEVHGFLPTLIGFGDIRVQTAGEDREFVLKGVAYPGRLKHFIYGHHRNSESGAGI